MPATEYIKNKIFTFLAYSPDNGKFFWVHNRPNGIRAGSLAGHRSGRYLAISLDGQDIYLHRLAFVFMTGDWPKNYVDHINRDKKDNRWSNLRDVDMTQNMYNASLRADNTSGRKGVAYVNRTGKWMSYIIYKSKQIHLGFFETFEDAVKARVEAERTYNALEG